MARARHRTWLTGTDVVTWVFIILKLCKVIDWSWGWIYFPLAVSLMVRTFMPGLRD